MPCPCLQLSSLKPNGHVKNNTMSCPHVVRALHSGACGDLMTVLLKWETRKPGFKPTNQPTDEAKPTNDLLKPGTRNIKT